MAEAGHEHSASELDPESTIGGARE